MGPLPAENNPKKPREEAEHEPRLGLEHSTSSYCIGPRGSYSMGGPRPILSTLLPFLARNQSVHAGASRGAARLTARRLAMLLSHTNTDGELCDMPI